MFPDWVRCCGSSLPYGGTAPTGPLSRSVSVGVVDVVGGGPHVGLIPPSRVGDFRAEVREIFEF